MFGFAHIGGGQLGLGLIVPTVVRALPSFTYILNHSRSGSESSDPKHHRILRDNRAYDVCPRKAAPSRIQGFEYLYPLGPDLVERAFGNSEALLVTTAVTDPGLGQAARTIAAGIAARIRRGLRAPVVVIPCENVPQCGARLRTLVLGHLSAGGVRPPRDGEVVFGDSIPDRICSRISIVGGQVTVSVEDYAMWYVAMPASGAGDPVREALERLPEVQVIPERQLPLYAKQKLWCFNGLHLLAAAKAYAYQKPRVAEVFAIKKVRNRLSRVAKELAFAVYTEADRCGLGHEFGYKRCKTFANSALDRIEAANDDMTTRILRDLLSLEPTRLITEFSERIRATEIVAVTRAKSAFVAVLSEIRLGTFLGKLLERVGEPAAVLWGRGDLGAKRLEVGQELLHLVDVMRQVADVLARYGTKE